MKHLLFIISSMGGGGAERVMRHIISYLSTQSEYCVSLLILKGNDNTYIDTIPQNVNIIHLNIKGRVRYAPFKIIKAILNIKPDLCFVGLDKLNIFLAPFLFILKSFGIKCMVRETNVLSYHRSNSFIIKAIYRIFYNQYDRVIAQSIDMEKDLIENWGIRKNKITKINNPIDFNIIDKATHSTSSHPEILRKSKKFVMIGRLSYQKGYDLLLERISNFKSSIPFKIKIFGKGDLKEELERTIHQYNLEDKVSLDGFTNNPFKEINESDGLILSSRYEGFPNVLLEANALGKPVFVNNCPGGINEIMINGQNGIVADFNSQDSFDKNFHKFLIQEFDPKTIIVITKSRYAFEMIMPQYRKVIDSVLNDN